MDVEKVVDAAIANGVVIELNASPHKARTWTGACGGAGRGTRPSECSVNPDAHDTSGLRFVRAGVNAARKGWLTRENVVNTLPLAKMEAWLAKKRKRR